MIFSTLFVFLLTFDSAYLNADDSAELVLVEDGAARTPIVLLEDAPRFTRLAADELAEYIEKISGVRPEIIAGEPDPIPDNAIWVGYQPVMEDLFPDIDFHFEHPEEILIVSNTNHLAIAGRDRWDPQNNVRQLSRGRELEGVQSEYGTVNAVYTFIQDYLDVRWLWAGELGEDIVERDRIAFSPFRYRHHPQIRARSGLFSAHSLRRWGFSPRRDTQNWVRFQRLLFDSADAPGGHGFGDWWERFHETHPEYFALQPDGTRGGGDKPYPRAGTVKICHSNPDVWQQWLLDVEDQIEKNPLQRAFNASPNDGGASGHCVCPDCLAWDHPDGETLRFIWQGISQDYVALSDRTITFANKVARLLRERYPDEDYYVHMLAYGNWRPVPVEVVPDDNVIILSVTNFHNRHNPAGRELFHGWAEVAPNLVWRPNLGFGLWNIGFPRVSTRRAIEDMKLAAENNVTGLHFDLVWTHWATQGPHYYMLAQMAWNPGADGEAILEDYYQRGFGKASDDVKAYWTLMEEANERIIPDMDKWLEVYDQDFFDRAETHLDRAMEAVKEGPGKYRRRVEFVRVGLDYTRALVEVKHLMDLFRESGEKVHEDKARTIWVERIRPLAAGEEYPNAINKMVRPGHSRGLRGYGMYPDDLERRW